MKPTVSRVWSALVVFPLALGLVARAAGVRADPPASPAAPAPTGLAGKWVVTVDFWGTPSYYKLELTQQGDALTGDLSGDKLEGTVRGDNVEFLAKDTEGGSEQVKATLSGGALSGTMVIVEGSNPKNPTTHSFTASLVPKRSTRPPRRHDFTPTVFHREFSPRNKPVLTIAPGDTIVTTTVDAGGTDAKGVTRGLGGNPQTGPFFVEGAVPGDTLVVKLVRVRLNRDWAVSDDFLVPRAVDGGLAVKIKDVGQTDRKSVV